MINPITFDVLAERRAFSTAVIMDQCVEYVNEFLEEHFNNERLIINIPRETLPRFLRMTS